MEKWNPLEDRRPDKCGVYIVTYITLQANRRLVGAAYWNGFAFGVHGRVLSWCPLPDPDNDTPSTPRWCHPTSEQRYKNLNEF